MSNNVWIDGIGFDYPEDNFAGLQPGQINCARADHGVQEAVDPDTGETHAIEVRMFDPQGRPQIVRMWRGGWENEPPRAGMCFACYRELNDPAFAYCPIHMSNRKLPGIDGCPICALDPTEKRRVDKHLEKMAFVARADVDEPEESDGPEPAVVVVAAADGPARAAALAQRSAARTSRG